MVATASQAAESHLVSQAERDDSARASEQWLAEADVRNPFAPQGVLTWTAPKRIVISPYHPFNRGLAAFFNARWDESVREFTASIQWDPSALPAYRYRALALAQSDGGALRLTTSIHCSPGSVISKRR